MTCKSQRRGPGSSRCCCQHWCTEDSEEHGGNECLFVYLILECMFPHVLALTVRELEPRAETEEWLLTWLQGEGKK